MDAKTFVVINPLSGRMERDSIRKKLKKVLSDNEVPHKILQTSEIGKILPDIESAIDEGYQQFMAVGGDGTISGVASGLVGTGKSLVIIPAGTGNILAKDLHIPMEMDRAVNWWIEKTSTIDVDAMQIENQYYFLNVSVGLSSKALANVNSRDKKMFGWLAYFASGLQGLTEVTPHEFRIEVDGKVYERQAVEVVVANSGIVQFRNLRLDPEIKIDDGKLSVCVIQGKTAIDYFKVASEIIIEQPEDTKVMKCYQAFEKIVIDVEGQLPVQADGDRIGHTPVTIKIVPSAVKFLTPGEISK